MVSFYVQSQYKRAFSLHSVYIFSEEMIKKTVWKIKHYLLLDINFWSTYRMGMVNCMFPRKQKPTDGKINSDATS